MGISWGEQSAEIAASPEACFDAIVDYETFPEWQSAVIATDVVERDGDGLGKIATLATYRLGIDAGVSIPGLPGGSPRARCGARSRT